MTGRLCSRRLTVWFCGRWAHRQVRTSDRDVESNALSYANEAVPRLTPGLVTASPAHGIIAMTDVGPGRSLPDALVGDDRVEAIEVLLTIPFPSCWCAWDLPEEVKARALSRYMEAVPQPELVEERIPDAEVFWTVALACWPDCRGEAPPAFSELLESLSPNLISRWGHIPPLRLA